MAITFPSGAAMLLSETGPTYNVPINLAMG